VSTRGSHEALQKYSLPFVEEELPVPRQMPDPQLDLVRRYARILRSARAEASRARRQETLDKASTARIPVALTHKPGPASLSGPMRRARA
jgi:hypothetical protein